MMMMILSESKGGCLSTDTEDRRPCRGIKYSLRHYIIYSDYRHVARLRVAMSTLN